MRRGHTLFELCAALLLASIALSAVVPLARGIRDRMALVAAREAVAGTVAEARSAAVVHGSAAAHLASGPWRVWVQAGDSVYPAVDLEAEWGVVVVLSRDRTATSLAYDAMGLGRVASETIRFRRGDRVASLVVSGYGRVRRE